MSYHDCCAAPIKTRSKWKLRGQFITSLKEGIMKNEFLFWLQLCVTLTMTANTSQQALFYFKDRFVGFSIMVLYLLCVHNFTQGLV